MRDTCTPASNGGANARIMKMMGLRKPTKLPRKDASEVSGERHKIKVTLLLTVSEHYFKTTAPLYQILFIGF